MTKQELKDAIDVLTNDIHNLSLVIPENFEDFNQHRLNYEVLQTKLQCYQTEFNAMQISSLLEKEIASEKAVDPTS